MSIGTQIIIDVYDCNVTCLESEAILKQIIENISSKLNATVLEILVHHFSPIGISCIAQISTSHIAIHTWPELRFAAIDIFSCSSIPRNHELQLIIVSLLDAKQMEIKRIKRGKFLHS